ncbi:MAG TPA: DUF4097 family beta strand repeat-containing protein [Gemmatimonadaceae bacterium]
MSRWHAVLSVAAALTVAGCTQSHSHVEADAFVWSGAVAAGKWVHLRNMTGPITVELTPDTQVDVHATKRWRRSGDNVRFVETATADGIAICTVYAAGADCNPDNYSGRHDRSVLSSIARKTSDASVDYVVRVPAGVNIDLGTVNGPINVAKTSGTVKAETVNGDVEITAHQGALELNTVNGSVTVALDTLPATGDITMHSVNGSITAVLPPQLDGTVMFQTVNGRISNGFPVTSIGPTNAKRIAGSVGAGGVRRIELSTVNGSVTLMKHAGTVE